MIEAFPQPSCLLFFLEQITDRQIDFLPWLLRYPAQCTGLEPLPESPQNKVCHRLHPEYTPFSCLPIICLSAIWKYLFLRNWSYLRHFLISWRKLNECYSKLLPTTSATYRLFCFTFHESKSVDVSKRVYVMLCNLWMCNFFTWSLLVKSQCASCIPSRTDRIVNVGAKWSTFLFIWCHIKSEKKFSVVVVLFVIFCVAIFALFESFYSEKIF